MPRTHQKVRHQHVKKNFQRECWTHWIRQVQMNSFVERMNNFYTHASRWGNKQSLWLVGIERALPISEQEMPPNPKIVLAYCKNQNLLFHNRIWLVNFVFSFIILLFQSEFSYASNTHHFILNKIFYDLLICRRDK